MGTRARERIHRYRLKPGSFTERKRPKTSRVKFIIKSFQRHGHNQSNEKIPTCYYKGYF